MGCFDYYILCLYCVFPARPLDVLGIGGVEWDSIPIWELLARGRNDNIMQSRRRMDKELAFNRRTQATQIVKVSLSLIDGPVNTCWSTLTMFKL